MALQLSAIEPTCNRRWRSDEELLVVSLLVKDESEDSRSNKGRHGKLLIAENNLRTYRQPRLIATGVQMMLPLAVIVVASILAVSLLGLTRIVPSLEKPLRPTRDIRRV